MSPIQGGAVVDACTLKNFSVVGRMDVLEKHFNNRARWTEAIQREAGRLGLPPLDWLGPAMSPGDNIEALIGVDEIRRGLGATRADPATLHLGEAEAIYVLERYHQDWTRSTPWQTRDVASGSRRVTGSYARGALISRWQRFKAET